MDFLGAFTGWIVAGLVALATVVGVFFRGRSKGIDAEREKQQRKSYEQQIEEATQYREAVEDRQKTDEQVKSTDEDAIREELTDWVDYDPADKLRNKD